MAHIFFNGCAGNVTAGKNNDGSHKNRQIFTQRIYDAIVRAESVSESIAVTGFSWQFEPVYLPLGEDMNEPDMFAIPRNESIDPKDRIKAAIEIAVIRRQDIPIPVCCLRLRDAAHILHLPGEAFSENQLFAQEQSSAAWAAVLSYGACGPGYICMASSYAEGGFEPTDSFVSTGVENVIREAISKLVKRRGSGPTHSVLQMPIRGQMYSARTHGLRGRPEKRRSRR